MRKILILAANPRNTSKLRLEEEVRDILQVLKQAKQRDNFTIEQRWAVNPRDLHLAMVEVKPQIVHFSGHGTGDKGLYFEDRSGNAVLVTGEALASLFKLFSIDCVILNGCYSEAQADVLREHVPYVIGMNNSISDRAAIEFAVGFYTALGNGESVEFSFDSGKAGMKLHNTGDYSVPVLLKGKNASKPQIERTSNQLNQSNSQNFFPECCFLNAKTQNLNTDELSLFLNASFGHEIVKLNSLNPKEEIEIHIEKGKLRVKIEEGEFNIHSINESTSVRVIVQGTCKGNLWLIEPKSRESLCEHIENILSGNLVFLENKDARVYISFEASSHDISIRLPRFEDEPLKEKFLRGCFKR